MNADDFMDTVDATKRSQAKDAEIESFKEDRNRFTVILRDKDAEIERLTRELREEREAFLSRQLHDTKLITELCDALGAKTLWLNRDDIALLQRAREATR